MPTTQLTFAIHMLLFVEIGEEMRALNIKPNALNIKRNALNIKPNALFRPHLVYQRTYSPAC
jgi:hypothetical protein